MKLEFNVERMLVALRLMKLVVPRRHPKRVLTYAKLTATPDRVVMSATNLDVSVRCDVAGVIVDIPGEVLLDVGPLEQLLTSVPDAALQLSDSVSGCRVSSPLMEVEIETEDIVNFPEVAEFDGQNCYAMQPDALRSLFRRTAFATDDESMRYALGGIKAEWENGNLIFVGTDGRRLAKAEAAASAVGSPELLVDLVITNAATPVIEAVLDTNAEVQFARVGDLCVVRTPTATVWAERLGGRFPQWREVFPVSEMCIEVKARSLLTANKAAVIATSCERRGVEYAFGRGEMTLTADTPGSGKARVRAPLAYDGEELTTCLDPRYLNEFLDRLSPDATFRLDYRDDQSAIVCTTDDGYTYVLMPLACDK